MGGTRTAASLDDIVLAARRSLEERRRRVPAASMERAALGREPRGEAFAAALRSGPGPAIIAECKRRSPSKGLLRAAYDPAAIARAYERAGAAALSVLTDTPHFGGSIGDLEAVRAATTLPVLRKDFVLDGYQVVEARAAGADAVLLIAAVLGAELGPLAGLARSLGLAALVEVHDEGELVRAVEAGATLVGVNNRNLRTMGVDLETSVRLAAHLPPGVTAVAESGIRTRTDAVRLHGCGYHALLVGERLMTAADPGAALQELIGTKDERA